jgi:hypothetical protein
MYKIGTIKNTLFDKFGLKISVDQIRKLERKGLYKIEHIKDDWRLYSEESLKLIVRAILMYYFWIPIEVINRDNRDELKPYLARINKAIKTINQ